MVAKKIKVREFDTPIDVIRNVFTLKFLSVHHPSSSADVTLPLCGGCCRGGDVEDAVRPKNWRTLRPEKY